MPIQQMLVGIGAAEKFAEATGGTVTTVGDYKVHAFTSTGTFTVTQLADTCLLYTSPSPRDATLSRMPSSA